MKLTGQTVPRSSDRQQKQKFHHSYVPQNHQLSNLKKNLFQVLSILENKVSNKQSQPTLTLDFGQGLSRIYPVDNNIKVVSFAGGPCQSNETIRKKKTCCIIATMQELAMIILWTSDICNGEWLFTNWVSNEFPKIYIYIPVNTHSCFHCLFLPSNQDHIY